MRLSDKCEKDVLCALYEDLGEDAAHLWRVPILESSRVQEVKSIAQDIDIPGIDLSADVTGSLLENSSDGNAELYSNSDGILCGTKWFDKTFEILNKHSNIPSNSDNGYTKVSVAWQQKEGAKIDKTKPICSIRGSSKIILAGERTALNFLQFLSGTASYAKEISEILKQHFSNADASTDENGTEAIPMILDTRKTIPNLRDAQKYAVRCGGCHNHRFGLHDAIMIKENHIIAAGGMDKILASLADRLSTEIPQTGRSHKQIIIEVEKNQELKKVLDFIKYNEHDDRYEWIIVLDNFKPEEIKKAISFREDYQANGLSPKVLYELSGCITKDSLPKLLPHIKGIDRISMGCLSKDIKSLDFSLRFINAL